ncbi:MAG TPA: hypothetical protein VMU01_11920 [Rhizomicrobium sp.]|nr:hypothetical protein [Rhizomicrobium sp.]
MLRNLVVFALFLFGAFFAGTYLAYGQIDPCRALAVEQARRSPMPTGMAEVWARIANSGESRPACTRDLIDSWRERLLAQR